MSWFLTQSVAPLSTKYPWPHTDQLAYKQYFDEDILYLVDCEFYYRMNLLYGPPAIIDDTLVAIRHHKSSATLNPEFISKKDVEINYCTNKYLQLEE